MEEYTNGGEVDMVFSLIVAIITFGMALLQLCLTLGAPFGEYVLGGIHKVLPNRMRLVSCAFFIAFILVGLVYLQKGNIFYIGFDPMFVNGVVIGNTLFLAYAIIGNGFLTKSKKEKYLMTPLSIIQFICSLMTLVLFFNNQ